VTTDKIHQTDKSPFRTMAWGRMAEIQTREKEKKRPTQGMDPSNSGKKGECAERRREWGKKPAPTMLNPGKKPVFLMRLRKRTGVNCCTEKKFVTKNKVSPQQGEGGKICNITGEKKAFARAPRGRGGKKKRILRGRREKREIQLERGDAWHVIAARKGRYWILVERKKKNAGGEKSGANQPRIQGGRLFLKGGSDRAQKKEEPKQFFPQEKGGGGVLAAVNGEKEEIMSGKGKGTQKLLWIQENTPEHDYRDFGKKKHRVSCHLLRRGGGKKKKKKEAKSPRRWG